MSCGSSDDDDEFVLSVYNKAAVKSKYKSNLNQLMSQYKKPSNNVVIKDNKADQEKIEVLTKETVAKDKKASRNGSVKNDKKKQENECDSPESSPISISSDEDELKSKNASDCSDIVVETVVPSTQISLRSINEEIDNSDSFEVTHEHIISNSPAYSTRRSKRLRKGLEREGRPPVLPKPKPRISPRKRRGKTIKDYFHGQEQKKDDNIIVLDDADEIVDECSDEEINSEVSVKINWKSVEIRRFQLRKFQKFSKVFEILMDQEKVPMGKIWLTFKGQKIKPTDTPESLNLKIIDFIEGGILSETTNNLNLSVNNGSDDSDKDDNVINIKFQDNKKNIVKLKLKNTEKLKTVMLKFAEQIEVPLEKIKFEFDGDIVDPNKTPEDLEIGNDEVIDVTF